MHRRGSHLAQAFAAALASVVVAAGCGSSNDEMATTVATSTEPRTVNAAQVEQGIEDDLSTASASVTSAKCPDDVSVQQGETFTCTVAFDTGASGRATVTQLGANKYSYELEAGSVQVAGSTAEAAIKKSLAAQGLPDAVVNCPDNIIVKVGTTVTCDLSSSGGAASGSVTFTFSDADGTVDPASVET